MSIDRILIQRHSRSFGNEGLVKGIPDHLIPLSPAGRLQSVRMGDEIMPKILDEFGVEKNSVYALTSPYVRAIQSYEIMELGKFQEYVADFHEDDRLIEWGAKLSYGMSKNERIFSYPKIKTPGARNRMMEAMRRDIYSLVDEIEQFSAAHIKTMLILTHMTPYRMMTQALGRHSDFYMHYDPWPENCAVRHLERNSQGVFQDMYYVFRGFGR